MSDTRTVRITINGSVHEAEVEPRRTLADFIREDAGLKGTHLACEHGFCGNCNVALDGDTIRSCLMFAVQADGREIETVEALCEPGGALSELQQAFTDHAAVQCGFCTPAMLLTAARVPARPPGGDRRGGDPGGHLQRRLPLHGLPADRRRHPVAGGARHEHRTASRRGRDRPGDAAEGGGRAPLDRQEHQPRRGPALPARRGPLPRRHRPAAT